MAWTVPKTWTAGEVVGETDMNTHIRDNLNVLKSPPFQQIVTASAGNYQTTASTAVPISTADLSITLTTYGDGVNVFFQAPFSANAGATIFLGLAADGTALFDAATGLVYFNPANYLDSKSFNIWVTGLASGSHTFQPTWKMGAGNQTGRVMIAESPAIFWAREG